MALKDVKNYYMQMLNQYLEVKNDLADFEQALKDGHITEEQLTAVKEDVEYVKNNLDRLSYIMFLFNIPNKKSKKEKYKQANKKLANYFEAIHVNEDSIVDENTNILEHLVAELKSLEEKK